MLRLQTWDILERLQKLIDDEGYLYAMAVHSQRIDSLIVQEGKTGKKFEIVVRAVDGE